MFFFSCCLKSKETLFLRVFWEKANKNVLKFFGLKAKNLKNCDFWRPYEKIPFLRSKNVSFLFRTWGNSIFKGILRRSKYKFFGIFFDQNRGLPLWKIAIFSLMKKFHFCGQEPITNRLVIGSCCGLKRFLFC